MRLFVAVTPPEDVLDRIGELVAHTQAELEAQQGTGSSTDQARALRWTTRAQWHVTLRFLGELDAATEVVAAIDGLPVGPTQATLGPKVTLLGQSVVCVPVAGLDPVAAAVMEATAPLGRPPDSRPFHGHLTLARVRRGHRIRPRHLPGREVSAGWRVDEVHVMRSYQEPQGSRYETLAVAPLEG